MSIIKCPVCGGDLEINEVLPYAQCPYCSNVITLPDLSDKHRENLFLRASQLWHMRQFDQSQQIYEALSSEYPSDPEAHWGALMTLYGIEYVEDPTTHVHLPTCHRVQETSILQSPHYLAALQFASDSYARELYENTAGRISEIQNNILSLSRKESPYDIFISYKEKTEGGVRTQESILAEDLYEQLTASGYKVFFSRITLEGKLGNDYEPVIFSALTSARVMLVLGTSQENLNSIWVRNEWTRFLAMMKQQKNKILIPCYYGMNPYDLPDELKILQAVDMSRLGFFQDLSLTIQHNLNIEFQQKEEIACDPAKIEEWIASGNDAITREEYPQADIYANKILKMDPRNAQGYRLKVQSRHRLARLMLNGNSEIQSDPDFIQMLRYADSELLSQLRSGNPEPEQEEDASNQYYFRNSQEIIFGTFTKDQLQNMINTGALTSSETITTRDGKTPPKGTFRYPRFRFRLSGGKMNNILSACLHSHRKVLICIIILLGFGIFRQFRSSSSDIEAIPPNKFEKMYPKYDFTDAFFQEKECYKLRCKLADEFDKVFTKYYHPNYLDTPYDVSYWHFDFHNYDQAIKKWDSEGRRQELEELCKAAFHYRAAAPPSQHIHQLCKSLIELYQYDPSLYRKPTKKFQKSFKDPGGMYEHNSYEERLSKAYYESIPTPAGFAVDIYRSIIEICSDVPRPYRKKKVPGSQVNQNKVDMRNNMQIIISH